LFLIGQDEGFALMSAFRLHEIEAVDTASRGINVVIDTPKGSRNKYKYDEALGLFRLSRVLPAGMSFPYDFGSVPRTRAEDGDALDVLVLADAPTFPGCLVTVELLGVIRVRQKEKGKTLRNDRLIAIVEAPVNAPQIHDINELDADRLRDIEHFFVSYNRAQGRELVTEGQLGHTAAEKILRDAMGTFARAARTPER
jgi:inorganic pyrophosphatase